METGKTRCAYLVVMRVGCIANKSITTGWHKQDRLCLQRMEDWTCNKLIIELDYASACELRNIATVVSMLYVLFA